MPVLGHFDPTKESVIIGGGVSGLILGHYLKKKALPFTLYEKNRLGGLISTKKFDQGLVETAANAIYANDDVLDLLSELGLDYIKADPKLAKWVFRDRPRRMPLSPKELLRVLVNLKRPLPANIHELSVAQGLTPLVGKNVAYEVVSTILRGVYASDASELHFCSLFGETENAKTYWQLFKNLIRQKKMKKKKSKGVTSISFEGGMQTFINYLGHDLKNHIHLQGPPANLDQYNVFVCTNAHDGQQFMPEEVASLLQQIPYRALTVATLFCSRPLEILEESFGILFGPSQGFKTFGILNNGAIFSKNTRSGNYSYNFIMPQGEAHHYVAHDVQKLCGLKLDEINGDLKVQDWPKAIPIYNRQHYQLIKQINLQLASYPGKLLFGNYTSNLSIRDIIGSAKAFAATL